MNTGRVRLARAIYGAFLPHLLPFSSRLILACASLVASIIVTLLEPWPLKFIFDQVLFGRPFPPKFTFVGAVLGNSSIRLLAGLCGSLVLIVLLKSIFAFLNRYWISAVGQEVTNNIRLALVDHLHGLSLASLASRRSGDVVYRLTGDIKALRDLLVGHAQNFGRHLLALVGTLAVMLWMDWKLTLVALAIVPPLYALSVHFSSGIRRAARNAKCKESDVASIVQETVTSLAVVQAFSQQDQERQRLVEESRESLRASLEGTRLGKAFGQVTAVVSACGMAVAVFYGATRVLHGQLSPGDLIVFVAYVKNLYSPIDDLSQLVVDFTESLVSGERLLEILQIDSQVRDQPGALDAPPFCGEITFANVAFGYRAGEPILKNLSFKVQPGQTVALVGSSGTGKSTVIALLLRFFDPWQGGILIDGIDIRMFKLESLRKQISVVLQEDLLFRRTIRENIAYGSPGAGLDEIVAAARRAQAHDFIQKMPHGYDTVLEERGTNLSGGQRQRIALARAMLKNSPIVVLDEPETGLDAITQARLRESLDGFLRGKTCFTIAHALSTIRSADLVLVIEGGEAVAQGTHAELLSESGIYRQLYELQERTAVV